MKKILASITLACACIMAQAQGYTIKQYDVHVKVNQDASLDVDETIQADFTGYNKHGIIRFIPFKYKLNKPANGEERADRQLESGGYTRVIIENIKVADDNYSTSEENGNKIIKIGSASQTVSGDKTYHIHYRMLNAINFFKDRSELYFNLIGDKWDTEIDSVNFTVELYKALSSTPKFFTATGSFGSTGSSVVANWTDNKTFTGHTTAILNPYEGVTTGITFPDKFLIKQNYNLRGLAWLALPIAIFSIMFGIWWKWGKDDKLTIMTEFYPPKGLSPSVAGYVIDDKLDRRDLTALVPYWGAGGYLKVAEKGKDFEFTKLKDLPSSALNFERTMFDGLFRGGSDSVMLNSLKNSFYTTMNSAKSQLESEVDRNDYYFKGTRGAAGFFALVGLVFIGFGGYRLFKKWGDEPIWMGLALILSGLIVLIIGSKMVKKTKKGNELYQKLAGFKEFITKVEKPRLQTFLKEDPHYFDTVLPYAIVFDVADAWKDKLKDLDIPPPDWYSGSYSGNFTTWMFLNSLDRGMNKMSENFYSQPSSSGGSSGGSWSSIGGGFSGGGFGGGGGSSW